MSESNHFGIDVNGDGDADDSICHLYDRSSGLISNLAVQFYGGEAHADITAFEVSEDLQGEDLNGDGDTLDTVVHVVSICGVGTVNAANGPPETVLRVNCDSGFVRVSRGQSIQVSLLTSSAGPTSAEYILWVWAGASRNPLPFELAGIPLGCLVNPTPLSPGMPDQPVRCLAGTGTLPAFCQGVPIFSPSPASAPWTRTKANGFPVPKQFSLQGILRDDGAPLLQDCSITNAVILTVE